MLVALLEFPILVHKPKTNIAGPFSPIVMPAQAPNVDRENELCFIVSGNVKDVSVQNAPDYILSYTVGNDVSSRAWQMPDTSGGRYYFAKSFNGFCPTGPKIVAESQIPDHIAGGL
jgi:2-keto-4-pentenoate hydratase/2-oxohepta-3-ene-1,7-dioic acid hydratase in catechol pathway